MKIDRYAVIGHPVAHSLSPRIHQAFAAQTAQSLGYEAIEAPLYGFAATVSEFFAAGGRGCNVTVPFKGEAAAWVTRLDPAAAFADAVNTIVEGPAGDYVGYNTDGRGLVLDLERLLPRAGNLSVLLLGAGGAARGVALPLLESIAGELIIANRTTDRAVRLADRLNEAGFSDVRAVPFQALAAQLPEAGFDLVINATSAGLTDRVPEVPDAVARGAFCYDMVYGGATAFCRWAERAGARATADGLGMLIGQAALAFQLWRGILPDRAPVLELLGAGS